MMRRAILPSNGGTWSCSFASSSAMSSGSRSRRVDNTWPNFTKIGPSVSRASRRRCPRSFSLLEEKKRKNGFPAKLGTNSYRPKRRPTPKMRARRVSLAKAADPLFQPLERVAQPHDVGGERIVLGAADDHAPLLGHIVGERLGKPPSRIRLPREQAAHALREAVRRDVADEARQVFLGDF